MLTESVSATGENKMVMNLTLPAYGAEPPFGPPLPSVGSLCLIKLRLGRGSWTFLLRCGWLRALSIILVVFPSRSGFRFAVGDAPPAPNSTMLTAHSRHATK